MSAILAARARLSLTRARGVGLRGRVDRMARLVCVEVIGTVALASSEGGLTVRFRLGPSPGAPPTRVTATAP
jgi:hypothetical protein